MIGDSSLVTVSSPTTRLGEVDIVCPELPRVVRVCSSVRDKHQKYSYWIKPDRVSEAILENGTIAYLRPFEGKMSEM